MKILFLFIISLSFLASCSSGPSIWEQKYKQAISSESSEEYEDAINLVLEAIGHKPDYYEGHLLLGNLYRKTKAWGKAAEAFDKAISLAPSKAAPLLGIGDSYLHLAAQEENAEEAEKTYRKSQFSFSQVLDLPKLSEEIRLTEEENFLALLGKGICLLERTLVEDARVFLKQAIELNSEDIDARFYNARIHEMSMGPNRKSLGEYKKILNENPKHLKTLLAMGDFYYKLDQNNKDGIRPYYESFVANGGISKRVKNWLDSNPRITQPVEPEPGQSVVHYTPPPPNQVKICNTCGRIYPRSYEGSVCEHDGGDLILQNE